MLKVLLFLYIVVALYGGISDTQQLAVENYAANVTGENMCEENQSLITAVQPIELMEVTRNVTAIICTDDFVTVDELNSLLWQLENERVYIPVVIK